MNIKPISVGYFVSMLTCLSVLPHAGAVDYFEDFDAMGKPAGDWFYKDDMLPNAGWVDICPGDGYAHVTFDSNTGNDTDASNPFQDIRYNAAGPGHRLEMRAKGAAISGVGGFLFTYFEDSTFDEIDIEVVPDDTGFGGLDHATEPPDGWTDARFNTWADSSVTNFRPDKSIGTAVVDEDGNKVSHVDDEFHLYTIEWLHGPQYSPNPKNDGRDGKVDFYIDGVHQATIYWPVPARSSQILMGVRQMNWTGPLNHAGTHTMLIDWFNVEPIDGTSPVGAVDRYRLSSNTTLTVFALEGVLANDTGTNLSAELISTTEHGSLTLNSDGGFTYTPDSGYTGEDHFVYRANDGTVNGESQAVKVTLNANAVDYFEDFDAVGKPTETWSYADEMLPVAGWNDFVPGDGYAHVTFDSNTGNDTDPSNPFQMLMFDTVGPGHRLEMRAKGVAISGVGGFIFTYFEDSTFDEIDIEVVPDDTSFGGGLDHPTEPPDGWTDARFNLWADTSTSTFAPYDGTGAAIVDEDGSKVSHVDDEFHLYTIDWLHGAEYSPNPQNDGRDGKVSFYIDGVHQATFYWPVPARPAQILLGVRQMNWTGPLNHAGTHTMLIDWFNVEPIGDTSPVGAVERYRLGSNTTLTVPVLEGVLANDTGSNLSAELISTTEHGSLTLNSDGGFTYTPDPDYTGEDHFVYRANDGTAQGESQAVKVTLKVVGKIYQAYILAGQSNADGYGARSKSLDYGTLSPNTDLFDLIGTPFLSDLGLSSDLTGADSRVQAFRGEYKAGNGAWGDLTATLGMTWNGQRFGPERSFGDWMANTNFDTGANKMAVIKYANPSTPIDPIAAGTQGHWDSRFSGTNHFDYLKTTIDNAVASLPPDTNLEISGILWMQGESDANNATAAANYETNLGNLVTDLRAYLVDLAAANDNVWLSDEHVRFAAGKITPGWTYSQQQWDALEALSLNMQNFVVVNAADLPLLANDGDGDAWIHYTTKGQVELGTRFANAMVETVSIRVSVDSYETPPDTQLVVAAPGVLSNDTSVSGLPLTAIKGSDPSHGALVFNTDGSFTYTPDLGYAGTDSFTYQATDGTDTSRFATVSVTVPGVDLQADLYAYYPLDTDTLDYSGNLRDGTPVNSPSFVPSQVGGGIRFDAQNEHVALPGADLTVPWTASYWVKREGNTDWSVLARSSDPSANNHPYLFLEHWDGSRTVGVGIRRVFDSGSPFSTSLNSWVHLLFVGKSSGVTLYVDGAPVGTMTSISYPAGSIGDSTGSSPLAVVDDVAVWTRALNAFEVQELFNRGNTGEPLVWSDRDNDGLSTHDEYASGTNPNDATSVFSLTDLSIQPNGTVHLEWSSVPNRNYTILHSSDLIDWTAVQTDIAPTAPTNQMELPISPDEPNAFYRVRTQTP